MHVAYIIFLLNITNKELVVKNKTEGGRTQLWFKRLIGFASPVQPDTENSIFQKTAKISATEADDKILGKYDLTIWGQATSQSYVDWTP